MRTWTPKPAFTLTEILVVVGIVVLVLGLSVPAKSVWESRKVQDAINLTGGLLSRAQSTAMIEHRSVGLWRTPVTAIGQIAVGKGDRDFLETGHCVDHNLKPPPFHAILESRYQLSFVRSLIADS